MNTARAICPCTFEEVADTELETVLEEGEECIYRLCCYLARFEVLLN